MLVQKNHFFIVCYIKEKIEDKDVEELTLQMNLTLVTDMAAAKKWWDKMFEEILVDGTNKCAHYRAMKLCPLKDTTPNCTYKWAVMKCVLMAGNASVFVPDLMKIPFACLPIHLGKITFEDDGVKKELVGLYFCKENTDATISGLYTYLCQKFKKDL